MLSHFQLNSETDFVSRGESFTALAKDITAAILAKAIQEQSRQTGPLALEAMKEIFVPQRNLTVGKCIEELASKVGENLQLRRVHQVSLPGEGVVASYMHRIQHQDER